MVRGEQISDVDLRLRRGIGHCRAGELEDGLVILREAYDDSRGQLSESAVALSYLGYASARCEDKAREGLRLCKLAAKRKFYDPEVQLNLSRVYLMLGDRRRAVGAMETGLKIHGEYEPLLQLRDEIGFRRPPVLRFLSRNNPVNQLLGRLRHAMLERRTENRLRKARRKDGVDSAG